MQLSNFQHPSCVGTVLLKSDSQLPAGTLSNEICDLYSYWKILPSRKKLRRPLDFADVRSLSQIDLLASGQAHVQSDKLSRPSVKQTFCAGSPVFCQMGKCCASGDVIGAEGELSLKLYNQEY